MSDPLMRYSDEVQAARSAGRPIVALESTIIAHGMPWPQNVETAREVEAIIRARGATPATIAVMGGQLCIGLSDAQLEQLGRDPDVMKLSRRDLPYAVAMGRVGATTVAATMICAARAGIEVFVTGGIGGERTMRLRMKKPGPQAETSAPALPLLTLEKLTYRFVWAGFVVLSLALVLGVWVTPVWHWDHKTVFSLLGWLVLAGLLAGRQAFGWRGRMATRGLYAGAVLLLLAYVGSRFVLEVLLHRTAFIAMAGP